MLKTHYAPLSPAQGTVHNMTTNRRQAINAAKRDLFDVLVALEGVIGPVRTAKLGVIVRRAMIAEFHRGEQAARGEQEATRLAYDSEELELKYLEGEGHGNN